MANIDWHIIGNITSGGKISIGAFSFGGESLFDAPIELDELIEALAASHEIPPDLLLSAQGRKELTQLAVTLAAARTDVCDRLEEDETKSDEVRSRESEDEKETP